MTTKYEDASSIVGSTFAAKLAAYEEKLRKKEKYKSEADALILKSRAQSRVLALVEKYNDAYTVYEVGQAIQRTNDRTHDIAYGSGSWPQKVRGMQFVIQSFIDDLQEVGAWDPRIKAAVHRGVHRLKKQAEEAHVLQQVKATMAEAEIVKAMVADRVMLRVLGRRVR